MVKNFSGDFFTGDMTLHTVLVDPEFVELMRSSEVVAIAAASLLLIFSAINNRR